MAARGKKPAPKPNVVAFPGVNPAKKASSVPATALVCPDKVVDDPGAKCYWDFYTTSAEHLHPMDAPALADLCMALCYLDLIDSRIADCRVNGDLVEEYEGLMKLRGPRSTEVRKMLSELYLTPTTRNRLSEGGPSKGSAIDPAAEFFA